MRVRDFAGIECTFVSPQGASRDVGTDVNRSGVGRIDSVPLVLLKPSYEQHGMISVERRIAGQEEMTVAFKRWLMFSELIKSVYNPPYYANIQGPLTRHNLANNPPFPHSAIHSQA